MHTDAFSFSQSVELYSQNNPSEKCFGFISYDTVWTEYADGSWDIKTDELDELAQFDYPKGTYGTFVVDFSEKDIKIGKYECRLEVVINQIPYETVVEFEICD